METAFTLKFQREKSSRVVGTLRLNWIRVSSRTDRKSSPASGWPPMRIICRSADNWDIARFSCFAMCFNHCYVGILLLDLLWM
ncbi:hypothetical protein BT93_B2313 [Corymbia citriodora subsp. variegata]|nr:hypothetical protein BT93_B2313 [Corymbia citriodora subsp. variegata]